MEIHIIAYHPLLSFGFGAFPLAPRNTTRGVGETITCTSDNWSPLRVASRLHMYINDSLD